jgi:hypothetical protein
VTNEVKQDIPASYEELKAAANRSSWKERLEAVEALGQHDSQQATDVLLHRLQHDPVYQVQEAAYRKLRERGEDVQLPPRKKGELIKGVGKVLIRIKKSLPAGHSFEEFKEKLRKTRLDVYDAYEGEKGAEFDSWLEQQWASISVR